MPLIPNIERVIIRLIPGHPMKKMYIYVSKRMSRYLFPNPRLITSDLFGDMCVRPSEFHDSRLYYFGLWEPCITDIVTRNLQASDVFIDVGANIGYYSLIAARIIGPTGLVFAIEPSPTIFGYLNTNVSLNNLQNVVTVCSGASNTHEQKDYYLDVTGNVSASGFRPGSKANSIREARIELHPLTDIVPHSKIGKAKIIKIDAEGYEQYILDNLITHNEMLRKDCIIISEIRFDIYENRKAIYKFIDLGFDCYYLPNDYSWNSYLIGCREEIEMLPVNALDSFLARTGAQIDVALTRIHISEI